MIGAIVGDIVGSRFEWNNIKSKEFDLFTSDCFPTDDTVLSLAIAKTLLYCDGDYYDLDEMTIFSLQSFGKRYPNAGYGGSFYGWMYQNEPEPYDSWGNGSAMRVSPCSYVAKDIDELKYLSKTVSEVTHNHLEGIKGAEATSVAIYMALKGCSKEEIKECIEKDYYKLDFTLDNIRDEYTFDVSCQGSVPQALEAFFESTSFEDAVRNAISIGGDSDTIAAISGSVAEAYYGVPDEIRAQAEDFLDGTQLTLLRKFEAKYGTGKITSTAN